MPLARCQSIRGCLRPSKLFHHPSTSRTGTSAFNRGYTSAAAPKVSRLRKRAVRSAALGVGIGGIWVVDREFNASAIARSLRTLYTCAAITLDYKFNFTPEKSEEIPIVHERVGNRVYELLTANGGLYIKIGQAIGANAALLPRPIQDKFGKLFDDAPQVPYSQIHQVFLSEFHRPPSGPTGIFEEFDEEAVASASVAQVHKAKLKEEDGGGWVAVKIQKPDVSRQVEWDLGAFRVAMWVFERWLFKLPVYFAVDFISQHLREELDFEREAANAVQTVSFVASEPRLASRVYIPKVYPSLTTKRVMTAEWIDGVRLSDRAGIRRLMGEETHADAEARLKEAKAAETLKKSFGDPNLRLKGGVKTIMEIMIELFSAQIFSWGWVHCDPHPGNVIIRPHPTDRTQAQLVLIDHGLYVKSSEDFKHQYASLWKGLLEGDYSAVTTVAQEWGIGSPDLFASATLLRPTKFPSTGNGEGGVEDLSNLSQYEMGLRMKKKLKDFLLDEDKMPKELIFIARNMRLVQGNNQALGSPVNRIKITGYWASRSLTTTPNLTFSERVREYWHYLRFRSIMFSLDLAFWLSGCRAWVRRRLGYKAEGFEDELERTMAGFAMNNFGVDIGPAFEG
ncbi:hypothetical protein JAAARDRAFT_128013 [Jaapia argillacea MUCL 33604]|uniref:ABC1 atypical kinase-like domain-containing protein n=1 Tax=Jaapia argillacea MUCL 33604 TaxID=933084 RepID=A0A067Q601_9AGAM|nr:hypothetical protein JAAARDRAFT_128013 [Jaapia argillacea MUCL 33604]